MVTNMGPVENMTVGYLNKRFIFQLGMAATSAVMNGLRGSLAMKSFEKPTGHVFGRTIGYLAMKSKGCKQTMSRSK